MRACGCDDDSVAHLARDAHRQYAREALLLFDDAEEVLRGFANKMPLALITNGASDLQREKLRSTGIEGLFSSIVVSGEVGLAKPDPAVFAIAIEQLGVDPQKVWHVGDSIRLDVGGAKASNLVAVWLNRNQRQRKDTDPLPDHEVTSLRQLVGLLQS